MSFSASAAPVLILLGGLCIAAGAEEAQPLTADGRLKRDPVFVGSSGKSLIFTVEEKPDQLRLMHLAVSERKSEPVHPDQTKSEFEPALSGDGRYLAFVQSRGNLSLALVLEDRQTGKQAEVPPGGGFSGVSAPAIAAAGTRMLFSYAERGRQHIFAADIELSAVEIKNRRILLESEGINNWPGFSPDGKQVVFASTRGGNYDVYLCQSDGTQLRQLTTSPFQDIRPRFSPDGTRIAFTSGRDGNYEIYVLDLSTGHETRLTNHPERDDYAAWHPDGEHLVTVSERRGRHDLYLVRCSR